MRNQETIGIGDPTSVCPARCPGETRGMPVPGGVRRGAAPPDRRDTPDSEVDQAERDALRHAMRLVRRIELAQRLLDEAFDGFR